MQWLFISTLETLPSSSLSASPIFLFLITAELPQMGSTHKIKLGGVSKHKLQFSLLCFLCFIYFMNDMTQCNLRL